MEYEIESEEFGHVIQAVKSISQQEALAIHADDRWITKTRDPAGYAMVATRVSDEVMDGYKREGVEEIGLKLNEIQNFISGNANTLKVDFDNATRKIYFREEDYELELSTIAPEYVSGKEQNFPDGEHHITLEGDMSFIYEFASRADDVLGTDHIVIGARENNFYLFAMNDNDTLKLAKSWDDDCFEDADIDDSDFPIDVILSLNYLSDLHNVNADESVLAFKNEFPVKFMFETDGGIPITYFIAPRVSDSSSSNAAHEVPDSALNEEDKKEL